VESPTRAAVDIEPGAISDDTFVIVTTAPVSQELSEQMLNSEVAALVKPVGPAITFGPDKLTFSPAATLTIPYDRAQDVHF